MNKITRYREDGGIEINGHESIFSVIHSEKLTLVTANDYWGGAVRPTLKLRRKHYDLDSDAGLVEFECDFFAFIENPRNCYTNNIPQMVLELNLSPEP